MSVDLNTVTDSAGDQDVVSPGPKIRHRAAYVEMLVSSLFGLLASFVLSIEAWKLAADPTQSLSCDLSSRISCSKVALTWQAHLLGFPNAFLGILFEAIVITVAVGALLGGRQSRVFMLAVQGLYAVAIVFAYWLFFQSYFVIGALCPWCLLITVTTLLVFMSMTRVNILDGHLRFGGATDRVRFWVRMGADYWLSGIVIATVSGMVIVKYL